MIQIVVGGPFEERRSGELEDSVEIGNRTQILFVSYVTDTWVALSERPAYFGGTVA
jgi:hypothetical protein